MNIIQSWCWMLNECCFFLDACTLISRASKPLLNCFKALRFVSSSRDTRWMVFLRAQDDEWEWEWVREWKISLLLASALPACRLGCGELHQSGLFNRLKTNAGNYLGQLFDLDLVKASAVVLELFAMDTVLVGEFTHVSQWTLVLSIFACLRSGQRSEQLSYRPRILATNQRCIRCHPMLKGRVSFGPMSMSVCGMFCR